MRILLLSSLALMFLGTAACVDEKACSEYSKADCPAATCKWDDNAGDYNKGQCVKK